MRAYRATVGDTDGNIIAAIITTQTPTNQPSVPRSVPGPPSIPRMRPAVDHQATAASANSNPTSAHRARAAPNAGARPLLTLRQAAQENWDVEKPDLPSYSMPKALICERVALEMLNSEPAGWKTSFNFAGSPDSMPNGTMSSISKSTASPMVMLCFSPSSRTSIEARSTPRFSPMSGPSAPIGPP